MRFLAVISGVTLLGLLPGTAWSRASLEGAVFLPDLHPDFPWTEGARGIERWYEESYQAAGLVRAWLYNDGETALSAASVKVGERKYAAYTMLRGEPVSWWRLRPDPVAPGEYGQLEIRLREPPQEPLLVEVALVSAGERSEPQVPLSFQVAVSNPRLRLGRVWFAQGRTSAGSKAEPATPDEGSVTLWAMVAPGFDKKLGLVVDGRVVQADRMTVLGPWQNVVAVVYRLPKPLQSGSFHYFALTADGRVLDATVVRARAEFVPLGTYGYVTPRDYAINSLNLYASFGTLARNNLDSLKAYGIRGVTRVTGAGPEQKPDRDTVGHEAIWAYYLHDEPDCADYNVEEIPHRVRLGTYAMEMVSRERNCYRDEPSKLTFLTIDQTYKPANWFHYGPIADVCNTDHYPPPGKERDVFSTVETCRLACAPQMLAFTYRAWWPEPLEPKENESRGRMMFAGEERLHTAWALAGGAQGLICYIHCTERIGNSVFHGAGEFADVWNEIGRIYREVETVGPVLGASWPVDGVVTAPQGVYARALVGEKGLVVVAINEAGCESTEDDFICRPASKVRLEVSVPPWLRDAKAWIVGEGALESADSTARDNKLSVELPSLETSKLILIASGNVQHALEARYATCRAEQAEKVLRGLQYDLADAASRQDLLRRIPARYKTFVAYAEGKGTYGVEKPGELWNPRGEKYNGLEWYTSGEPGEHWVQWRFSVREVGEHWFVFQWRPLGTSLRVQVEDSAGNTVVEGDLGPSDGEICGLKVTLSAPGDYRVRISGVLNKGSAGRFATAAYLVPAGQASMLPAGARALAP